MGPFDVVGELIRAFNVFQSRRRPGLTRPIQLTGLRWLPSEDSRVRSPGQVARLVRRVAVAMSITSFVLAGLGAHGVLTTRNPIGLAIAVLLLGLAGPFGAVLLLLAANISVSRASQHGVSGYREVVEMNLAGRPEDVLSEWQAFARRRGWQLTHCAFDPQTGLLALMASRIRSGALVLPQLLAVVGTLHTSAGCSLTVLCDVPLGPRWDFGTCYDNMTAVTTHFTAPPPLP